MTLRNMTNNQKKITVLAVGLSLIFCAELTGMGFAKFNSVSSGGENFYDFPARGFSWTRFIVNTAYISLNTIYVIWLLQYKRNNNYSNFLKLFRHAAIFIIIAFVTYPFSSDIYLYLQYGLMGLNGINPYTNPAFSFSSVLSPFLHWGQTATYGPISQLFFIAAASTVAVSPILGVYVFKIFCVIIHGINAYLIWNLLKTSTNQSKITMAYLINPLLLSEHLSGGHVDVFLCNTLIILIGCLYYRYYIAASLAIGIGFLVKTLPIIWLPMVSSFLLRQRRWKALAIAALLYFVIIILLSYTVLPTVEAWKSLLNPGVEGATSRSLHHLLNLSLNYLPNISPQTQEIILSVFKFLTYLSFAIYYIWTVLQPYLRRSYSEANLISDIGWSTLVLFLFATPWVMPWYPSVLLPVTALSIHSQLFVLTSLTFCLSSSVIVGGGSGGSALSIITSLTTVGPPILVLLFGRQFLDRLIEREHG
jgi:alpha-1,6-mannosyltransferase